MSGTDGDMMRTNMIDGRPSHWLAAWRVVRRGWVRFAARRSWAIACCGLVGFAAPLVIGEVVGFPKPSISDEFSYLLGADTFAAGRLTNPTHPQWRSFETIHILQTPSYNSKYFPANASILALGQRLFGHPAYGLWLSLGLMGASLCWMLQGWTRPAWALLGALLAIGKMGIVGPWAQTYMGGPVPAIGASLYFGGLQRLLLGRSRKWVVPAILLASGLVILANSRPFEGTVIGVAGALWIAVRLWRGDRARRWAVLRAAPLIAFLLALGAAAMGYYNYRVTGSALKPPYMAYQEQYDPYPLFVFASKRETTSPVTHPMVDAYIKKAHDALYEELRWRPGLLARPPQILWAQIDQTIGLWLSLALVMLPWMLSNARFKFALLTWGCFVFAMAFSSYATAGGKSHYWAPIMPLLYALVMQGLRRWRTWTDRMRPRSALAGRGVVIFLVGLAMASCVLQVGVFLFWARWVNPPTLGSRRAAVVERLENSPGADLVFVRYGANHDPLNEWVYNAADLDNAPIVWAREVDPQQDRTLIQYYNKRNVWLLRVRDHAPELQAYPVSSD